MITKQRSLDRLVRTVSIKLIYFDLQQKGHRYALVVGAEALKVTALNLHPHKATALTEILEWCC